MNFKVYPYWSGSILTTFLNKNKFKDTPTPITFAREIILSKKVKRIDYWNGKKWCSKQKIFHVSTPEEIKEILKKARELKHYKNLEQQRNEVK